MKKIYLLAVAFMLLGEAGAEEVSSVSFNPSRLGDYEVVKVSERANLYGGLNVSSDLQITSRDAGTVTMQNNTRDTRGVPQNKYLFRGINPETPAEYTQLNAPSAQVRLFVSGDNVGKVLTYNAATDTLNVGLSALEGASSYAIPLSIQGGTLEFTGQGPNGSYNKDSFINQLAAHANLLQYARELNVVDGKRHSEDVLNITGNEGSYVPLINANLQELSGMTTHGFTLGGGDIPHPAGHTFSDANDSNLVNLCLGSTCTNESGNSISAEQCNLAWVDRYISNTANTVKVLALENCTAGCTSVDEIYYQEAPCGQSQVEVDSLGPGTQYPNALTIGPGISGGFTGIARRRVKKYVNCATGERRYEFLDGPAWDTSDCKKTCWVKDGIEDDYRQDFTCVNCNYPPMTRWQQALGTTYCKGMSDNPPSSSDSISALRRPEEITGVVCDREHINETGIAAYLQVYRKAGIGFVNWYRCSSAAKPIRYKCREFTPAQYSVNASRCVTNWENQWTLQYVNETMSEFVADKSCSQVYTDLNNSNNCGTGYNGTPKCCFSYCSGVCSAENLNIQWWLFDPITSGKCRVTLARCTQALVPR